MKKILVVLSILLVFLTSCYKGSEKIVVGVSEKEMYAFLMEGKEEGLIEEDIVIEYYKDKTKMEDFFYKGGLDVIFSDLSAAIYYQNKGEGGKISFLISKEYQDYIYIGEKAKQKKIKIGILKSVEDYYYFCKYLKEKNLDKENYEIKFGTCEELEEEYRREEIDSYYTPLNKFNEESKQNKLLSQKEVSYELVMVKNDMSKKEEKLIKKLKEGWYKVYNATQNDLSFKNKIAKKYNLEFVKKEKIYYFQDEVEEVLNSEEFHEEIEEAAKILDVEVDIEKLIGKEVGR